MENDIKLGKFLSLVLRHGRQVVLAISAVAMHEAGYTFYLSENGVWLTDHVPVKYIKFG